MPVLLLLLVLGVGSLEGQLVMKHLPKGLEEAGECPLSAHGHGKTQQEDSYLQ